MNNHWIDPPGEAFRARLNAIRQDQPEILISSDAWIDQVMSTVSDIWTKWHSDFETVIQEKRELETTLSDNARQLEQARAQLKLTEDDLDNVSRFPEENPGPVLRISPEGKLLYANPAARALFGKDYIPDRPASFPAWLKRLQRAVRRPGRQTLELEVGEEWISFLIVPVAERGYINLYGREDTARKRAEALAAQKTMEAENTAREAQQRVAEVGAFLAQLNDGVVIYNRDGIPVRVNPAVISAYGFDPTGIPPVDLAKRIQVTRLDDSPWTPEEFVVYRALRGETVRDTRLKLVSADGKTQLLTTSGNPIRDEHGHVIGAAVIFHDITEQQRLETEIQHQRALLDAVFEADPSGLAVVTGPELRLIYANPAYRFICPNNGGEIIGQPYEAVWSAEDPNCYAEPIRQVVQTGRPFQALGFERHFFDGTTRTFTLQARRIAWDGQSAALVILWDTTEHDRAEQRLAFQANLLANISDIVYATDEQLHITAWNHAAERMYGWKEKDVLGKPVLEVVQSQFDPKQREKLTRELMETGSVKTEVEHRTRSGDMVIFEAQTLLQCNPSGKVTGFVSVNHDVTERKQTEQALRASEQRLATIFASISDCCYTLDPEWRFTTANEPALRYFQKTREELIGRVFWAVFPQAVGTPVEKYYRKAVREQTRVQYEMLSPISGIWVDVSVYPSEQGLFVIVRDITENKQAELALAESEARYRELVENANSLIIKMDQSGTITFFNEFAQQFFGYTPEEILGRDVRILVPKVESASGRYLDEMADTILESPDDFTESINENVRKNGERVWISWRNKAIRSADGQIIGNLTIGQDITQRKQAEDTVRESQMLLRAVIENTQDPVFVKDRQSRILLANQALATLVGKPIADIVGKTDSEYYDNAAIGQALRENDLKVMESEESLSVEETVMTREGGRTYLSAKVPYRDPEGKVIGVIGISRDITERKQAENRQAETLRFLETLHAINLQIAQAPHSADLLHHALQLANDAMRSDASSISIRTKRQWTVPFVVGLPEEITRQTFTDEENALALHVLHTGEALLFDHQHASNPQMQALAERLGVKNALILPLTSGEQAIGVLSFHWVTTGQQTTAEKLDFGGKLAASLSLALVNRKQFERMQQEIGEREQVEQALRESEQLYRAIGESIDYGVWVCDPDGRNIYASESFLRLVGITQQQCSEFGWGDTLHPEDAERTIAAWKECVRTEGTWDIEHRFRGVDGQYHPILARGMPVRNEQGKIIYWAGINLDISRFKQAERALQESESRFRTLADSNPIPIWVTDAQGRNQYVNRTYCEFFGVSSEQAEGDRWQPFIHPEDRAVYIAAFMQAIENQVPFRGEMRALRKDGEWRWMSTYAEPRFSATGQFIGHVGNTSDITERVQSEAEKRDRIVQIEIQRRLLEQREQERLQIARDLHDGTIQELTGAHYALEGILYTVQDETLAQGLKGIRDTIKDQVAELRAYASELRPPTLSKFGLGKAIRSHMEAFQEKHPEMQIRFEDEQVGELLPPEDRLALFRIFQEALTNIAKHAHATEVTVRLEKTETEARLEIRDNGLGFTVPTDWLELARAGHLGLVGMRERAESIGGVLEIQSAPGMPTRLIVTVPLGK